MSIAIAKLEPGHTGFPERLGMLGWKRTLYVRGLLDEGPAIAIVGARGATTAGMQRAFDLAQELAGRGMRIVSGGALGIDGAAHRGALAANGKTTVVLGSGVDVHYPARHSDMFEMVVGAGGALVSMMKPGEQPRHGSFPARNPLIAALADAVVVIEADVRSGSLQTARAGAELGRVVGACPGSRGCERLLVMGAAIVETVEDLESALAGAPRLHAPPPLDATATQIAGAMAAGARGVDALVRETGLPVRDVLRALSVLETSARFS